MLKNYNQRRFVKLEHAEGIEPKRENIIQMASCGVGAVAAAVAGSAVLGAGMSYMSSKSAADAQKDAANKAKKAQKEANDLNYKQFKEGRGSEGSAVLPLYLKTPEGGMFEEKMGKDIMAAYEEGGNLKMGDFGGTVAGLQPAQFGAQKTVSDIFGGGITQKMLANTAPERQARTAAASTTSMEALNKTLANINATQAGRGYSGDSYASRLLQLQAQQATGQAQAQAQAQNLKEIGDIRNYGDVTLPMQNLQQPMAMARQAGQFQMLPSDLYYQMLSQRMQPLNMIKIGSGTFQYQPLPTPPPDYSNAQMWSSLGQAGGGLMGAAASYFGAAKAPVSGAGGTPGAVPVANYGSTLSYQNAAPSPAAWSTPMPSIP